MIAIVPANAPFDAGVIATVDASVHRFSDVLTAAQCPATPPVPLEAVEKPGWSLTSGPCALDWTVEQIAIAAEGEPAEDRPTPYALQRAEELLRKLQPKLANSVAPTKPAGAGGGEQLRPLPAAPAGRDLPAARRGAVAQDDVRVDEADGRCAAALVRAAEAGSAEFVDGADRRHAGSGAGPETSTDKEGAILDLRRGAGDGLRLHADAETRGSGEISRALSRIPAGGRLCGLRCAVQEAGYPAGDSGGRLAHSVRFFHTPLNRRALALTGDCFSIPPIGAPSL